MFRVQVHKLIRRITLCFYLFGFWHHGDVETPSELILKIFYSIYHLLFPMSLVAGAIISNSNDEKVFFVELAVMTIVAFVKLLYIIWRKREILELLNELCEYSVEDREAFTLVNDQVIKLMKFSVAFIAFYIFSLLYDVFVMPFAGAERTLCINLEFLIDWKSNEYAYWLAYFLLFTQICIITMPAIFTVVIWYLMANCAWKYEVIGQRIRKMGEVKLNISDCQRENLYGRHLIEAIESHNKLTESTKHLDSFLCKLFGVKLTTGAMCICTASYCIAFVRGDNMIEFYIFVGAMIYAIFAIYMIMYFGNEIKLKSDRLSYNLFESNWIDQPQSIKRSVIVFGELLMQPKQLVILKLYPLTLETFTMILNSAYSMFNILQNLK